MVEEISQKRNWIIITGIILTVFCSAFIGFFNIAVLYLFGVPVFGLLLGIIFIWFSKEKVKTKILLTLIPIPIIPAAFFLFYVLLPKAEPEMFLIPQNFRGQFEIIFNESCGGAIPYENGKRIYHIPASGVLITNAQETLGVIDRKVYLIDENGSKTELPEFHWSKFEEEQNDWHWTFSKTNLSKNLVGFNRNPSNINYLIFTVSDYQSLENESVEIRNEKRKTFQNTIDSSLRECRSMHLK